MACEDAIAMEFFRHSLDRVLQRTTSEHALPEVLWPDGRWAPDASVDLLHYCSRLSEPEARAFADEYVGRPVDLTAPAMTAEECEAEIARSRDQLRDS